MVTIDRNAGIGKSYRYDPVGCAAQILKIVANEVIG